MTYRWMCALLFAASAFAETAPEREKGRLCLARRDVVLTEGTCTDTKGLAFAVVPADAERLFLWTSADGKTAQFGVLPAKEDKVDLNRDELRAVTFSIDGERSRGWPLETKITVGGQAKWEWTLTPRAVSRLQRVYVPRSAYTISLRADHHHLLKREKIAAVEGDFDAGVLQLRPFTRYRGRVIDADLAPVSGAMISFSDGTHCARTDEQGSFECEEIEKRRPQEGLLVRVTGRAQHDLDLPAKPDIDVDLGVIQLQRGQNLTLKLKRKADEKPVKAALYYDAPRRYDHTLVETRELEEGIEEITFGGVSAGKYIVLIEGEDPLQRTEHVVEMKAGEAKVEEIEIDAYVLEGTALANDEKIADATLQLIGPANTWRHPVQIRDGAFRMELWQKGSFVAFLNSELLHSPSLGDTDPSRWDIRLHQTEVKGRVLDAADRTPVSGVKMNAIADTGRGRSYRSVNVGEDGSYSITMKPGTLRLQIQAPDHVAQTRDIRVVQEDTTKIVDIALERGILQELAIVTPAGAPIPDALILEGVETDGHNPQRIATADAAGKFRLRAIPGERRTLFVIPREGSFAVVRVNVPRAEDAKPMQIVVPPATSALRVRSVDPDGNPVPSALIIRYNGEVVPAAMFRFVAGESLGTGPAGEAVLRRLPAGMYEVWARWSPADEGAAIAGSGPARQPERVGLSGGEQSVTVLAPKRPAPKKPAGD